MQKKIQVEQRGDKHGIENWTKDRSLNGAQEQFIQKRVISIHRDTEQGIF
jgi:hypothetical protein